MFQRFKWLLTPRLPFHSSHPLQQMFFFHFCKKFFLVSRRQRHHGLLQRGRHQEVLPDRQAELLIVDDVLDKVGHVDHLAGFLQKTLCHISVKFAIPERRLNPNWQSYKNWKLLNWVEPVTLTYWQLYKLNLLLMCT